jgi:uncharacterized SAM-binding protein YcdF (DUF218 family)
MIDQEYIWTLKTLILPPGGIVLIWLLGLLLSRRLLGKLLLLLAPALLYLLSTPYIAVQLMRPLETFPALAPESVTTDSAQAIVVLGSGIYESAPEYEGRDTVGRLLLERVRYAAWLHHRTGLPVIASGGNAESREHSEAYLMQQVLQQEFNAKVVALEEESRTTWENAENTKALLQQLQIEKFVLVTHAWHMPRAVVSFRAAGTEPIAAPTAFVGNSKLENNWKDWRPSSRAFSDSYYALHEYVGKAWYALRDTQEERQPEQQEMAAANQSEESSSR